MPVSATFNGTVYNLPATGETGWGTTTTNFLVDVGNNALCLTGTQTVSNKVLTLQNGSAATPSLAFTADTASGLYQPLSGEVAISAGGVQRLLVDTSGVINVLGAPGIVNASAGDLSLQSTSGAVRAPTMALTDKSTAVATTAFVQTVPAVVDNIGRNKIQNPKFDIWQRGAGAFTANLAYTADRWQINLSTDSVSTSKITLADADRTALGDEEAVFCMTTAFTGTSGASAFSYIKQPMENLRRFTNKTLTVSLWAKAAVGTPKLGFNFVMNYGSGGSPTGATWAATTGTPTAALSSTWTKYSATIAIPTGVGATFGTNLDSSLGLGIFFSSGSTVNAVAGNIGVQTGTVSIWGVQVEIGSTVTALEKVDPAIDAANCMRFYQTGTALWGGECTNGVTNYAAMGLTVSMRTTPSGSITSDSSSNFGTRSLTLGPQFVLISATAISTAAGAINAIFQATADF
jgi:hypothetical protein